MKMASISLIYYPVKVCGDLKSTEGRGGGRGVDCAILRENTMVFLMVNTFNCLYCLLSKAVINVALKKRDKKHKICLNTGMLKVNQVIYNL